MKKESLHNIEIYSQQKSFTFGTEILTATYEECFLVALIANHRNRRTVLSRKVLKGSEDKKTNSQLKEAIKWLTFTIDTLVTELEHLTLGWEYDSFKKVRNLHG